MIKQWHPFEPCETWRKPAASPGCSRNRQYGGHCVPSPLYFSVMGSYLVSQRASSLLDSVTSVSSTIYNIPCPDKPRSKMVIEQWESALREVREETRGAPEEARAGMQWGQSSTWSSLNCTSSLPSFPSLEKRFGWGDWRNPLHKVQLYAVMWSRGSFVHDTNTHRPLLSCRTLSKKCCQSAKCVSNYHSVPFVCRTGTRSCFPWPESLGGAQSLFCTVYHHPWWKLIYVLSTPRTEVQEWHSCQAPQFRSLRVTLDHCVWSMTLCMSHAPPPVLAPQSWALYSWSLSIHSCQLCDIS